MADQLVKSRDDTGLAQKYKDMGDGSFAPQMAVVAVASAQTARAYASSNSNVGAASALLIAAATYNAWLTIQNTHATQKLSLSFTNPATVSDVTLQPGQSLTMTPGPSNALYGIGSGAATTYAIMGA